MNKIHLICNPVSGKGNTQVVLEKIKEWIKTQNQLDIQIHLTENEGHATVIARDLTATNDPVTLLVLGGDGTLNEVLNGIVNFKNTNIGLLPFGSGNDFAVALNLPTNDPIALVNAYVNQPQVHAIDYLLLNDKYRVINCVGLGMSAEVISYRNKMKHFKPKTQYKIASTVRALLWKGFTYKVSYDKQPPLDVKSMWFTINNGVCVGSGMYTAKHSKIDDGLISVMCLQTFNRIKTLSVLMNAKKGNIDKVKYAFFRDCKEIDIDLNDDVVEFDGNLIEHQNHVNVKVIEKGVNFLFPISR